MRRNGSEVLTRLVTIALLSALGFVLMSFARFPYPFAPWLMIEVSDMVVLISYALYGFIGGISVAIMKTLLDVLIYGPVGFYGIGNITALLTSLLFVLGLFITSHILHLFKKGFGFRIIGYLMITVFVALIMTLLNVICITPTYLTGTFATCFDSEVVNSVISAFNGMGISGNSYFWIVVLVYFPFNLMKGGICCLIYELVFNRLIFLLLNRSPMMRKYFLGPVFKKEGKNNDKEETQK